jgi:alpha-D-ribose 1-methylphosphonate 5-triphosphate synthase subunit PhnI
MAFIDKLLVEAAVIATSFTHAFNRAFGIVNGSSRRRREAFNASLEERHEQTSEINQAIANSSELVISNNEANVSFFLILGCF